MGIFKLFKKRKTNMKNQINKINSFFEMNIDEIFQLTDKNSFVVALNFWLNKKSNYGEDIKKLSKPEMCVFVVNLFLDETNNGGFEQFLFNSSGTFFGDLLFSLDEVGMKNISDFYRNTLSIFPAVLPKDEDERDSILFNLCNEELSNKLAECDKKLYLISSDEIENIIFKYVQEHKQDFLAN